MSIANVYCEKGVREHISASYWCAIVMGLRWMRGYDTISHTILAVIFRTSSYL